jgi:hypothetical protein
MNQAINHRVILSRVFHWLKPTAAIRRLLQELTKFSSEPGQELSLFGTPSGAKISIVFICS